MTMANQRSSRRWKAHNSLRDIPTESKRSTNAVCVTFSCFTNGTTMADAVGIDHVGIGTHTDLLSPRVGQGANKAYAGLAGGFFNAAIAEMMQQGFTPDDIAKVGGGNFCRVFGQATAGRA